MKPAVAPSRNFLVWAIALGVAIALGIIIVMITTGGSGSRSHYSVTGDQVTISAATVGNLGKVLVTDQGYALYMFPPDHQESVTCEAECAQNWPPLIIPEGVSAVASDGIDASLLSTVKDAEGNSVASYNGWPLYTYVGDVTPYTATGQAQFLDGGYWYVIRPNGEVKMPGPQN